MKKDHQDYYNRKVARAEEVLPYLAVFYIVAVVYGVYQALL
tara:strand:- start:133 stop:255 length:123 start_codon:yes stop_codon:yes gene_type:complete